MAEVREVTYYRLSIAACIAAISVPIGAYHAVEVWRMPERVRACVAGGGSWQQGWSDGKATDEWACFPPNKVGTRG